MLLDDLTGFMVIDGPHRSDEPISALGNSFDVPLVILRVLENPSQAPDVMGEVSLLDEGVWPERLHQLFLFQQMPPVFYQENKRLECLACECYVLTVAQESTFSRVQAKPAKFIGKAVGGAHFSLEYRTFTEF